MPTVETLGEAWTFGWRVHMHCAFGKHDGMRTIRACVYRRELDMETLICTRGATFPLSRLTERLKCPRCNSRVVRVIYEPPSERGRAAASER